MNEIIVIGDNFETLAQEQDFECRNRVLSPTQTFPV